MKTKTIFTTLLVSSSLNLFASSGTWTPTGGGFWAVDANWTGANYPNSSTDDATIGTFAGSSGGTINIQSNNISVGQLEINNANQYSITGTTGILDVFTGINIVDGIHQLALPGLNLSSNLINISSTGQLSISAPITGSSGLTLTGSGLLTLSGANSYTGTTSVNGGVLLASNNSSFGDSGNSIAISNGELEIANNTTIPRDIAMTTSANIRSDSTMTLSGVLSGNSSVTFLGSTINLTNTNTFTGPIALELVTIDKDECLGNPANTITGTPSGSNTLSTTASFSSSREIIVGGGGFTVNTTTPGTTLTWNGKISGGSFEKRGSGTMVLTLTNASDYTYSDLNISFGTLSISNPVQLGTDTSFNIAGNGSLEITQDMTINQGFSCSGRVNIADTKTATVNGIASGNITINSTGSTGTIIFTNGSNGFGNVDIASGTMNITGAGILGASTTLTLSGASSIFDITGITSPSLQIRRLFGEVGSQIKLDAKELIINNTSSGTATYDGVIQGTNGKLTKQGTNIQELSGINTYGGPAGLTTISVGTLSLLGSGTAGASDTPMSIANGATFNISGITASTAVGSLTAASGSSINLGAKNLTINEASSTTVGATISGVGGTLTKEGTAILTLSGTNTYSGGTNVNDGTLSISSDSNLGNVAGGVALNNGTTLQTTASLTSARTYTLTGATTIDVTTGTDNFTGTITGTGSLNLTGTGTKVFSNGSKNYSGGTTVSAGTLQLNAADQMAGDITNNAILDLEASSSQNYSGVISGTGAVTVNSGGGTSVVTLSATNTYQGGTTVDGGTLAISSDSNLGQAGTPLALNSATLQTTGLTTNRPITLTGSDTFDAASGSSQYTGTIGGTGSLDLVGSGTTIFSGGAKTYTGSTTITGGTLQLNAANQMAATINNFGTLDLESTAADNYIGEITGTGNLNVNSGGGTGVVTISNSTNNYSGSTNVTAGTLRIGAVGALPSGTELTLGNGTTAGALDLNGNAASVTSVTDFASTPSTITFGGGSLTTTAPSTDKTIYGTLTGPGQLILDGTNSNTTLAGTSSNLTAQINQGNLIVNPIIAPNNVLVTSQGTFTIVPNTPHTYVGAVAGTGTVNQTGAARLTLEAGANFSGFTGQYNVTQGELKLNTLMAGNLNIALGALLTGTGTIGGQLEIAAGAKIAPGNSIGTITVNGNYTQAADSTYLVQIDGAGNSTLIDVAGAATLAGGFVDIDSVDGVFTTNIPYTILHADGGVTGTFTSAAADGFADGSVVIPLLSYTATDVFFTFISQNQLPIGGTGNQKAVAKQIATILSPTSGQANIIANLISLPTDEQNAALDAMSGEQYTNYANLTEFANRQFLRRMYDPIRPIVTSTCDLDSCCACPGWTPKALWIEGGSTYSKFVGNENAPGYATSGFQIAGGVQVPFDVDVTVGAVGGYAEDSVEFRQYAKGTNRTTFAGVYTLYRPEGYYLFADVAYGYSANRFHRHIEFGTVDYLAKSRPKITQTTLYAEAGKDFNFWHLLIQPFVGVEADYFHRKKLHETGANDIGLIVYSQSRQRTFGRFGFHITDNDLPWNLSLSVDAAWLYLLSGNYNNIYEHFETFGEGFTIKGVTPSRNSFEGAVTLSMDVTSCFSIFAEFSGSHWSNATSYTGLGGIEYKW